MKPTRLAVIAARGGSKRLPRKNVRAFLGRPILTYPIRAAVDSGLFEEVTVSTDDAEIAALSLDAGATVPTLRSAANASDTATLSDVLVEVLERRAAQAPLPEHCCLLLPTAPFVTAQLLRETWEHLARVQAPALVPLMRFSFPIQRAVTMDGGGAVAMMWPEHMNTRSQDLPGAFHDAGQFYWVRTEAFLLHKRLWMPGLVGHELDATKAQDIDTEEDWKVAELKYRMLFESPRA